MRRKRCSRVCLLLVWIILAGCAPAPATSIPTATFIPTAPSLPSATPAAPAEIRALAEQSAAVDEYLAALVPQSAPGAAVLVLRDGEILHMAGYGMADLERQIPVTPATGFNLASVSKPFTALLIMRLAEAGRLGYDDPVRRHLPEVTRLPADLTVRHLLTHTSGLADIINEPALYERLSSRGGGNPTLADFLDQVAAGVPVHFRPGDRFEYNNSGYILLAAIIERLTGQTYAEALEELVTPLRMTRTYALQGRATLNDPDLAHGYLRGDTGFQPVAGVDLGEIPGAGHIVSSLADLIGYTRALEGGELLPTEALAEGLTPALLNSGKTAPYGFGWFLLEHRGRPFVWHGGAVTDGYLTSYGRFPEDGLTVVLLLNVFDPDLVERRDELTLQIADLYLP